MSPTDVDQLAPGQSARVKVRAFNQRSTPELSGRLARIAPDTSQDPQSGEIFYTIRVAVPAPSWRASRPMGWRPACRPTCS